MNCTEAVRALEFAACEISEDAFRGAFIKALVDGEDWAKLCLLRWRAGEAARTDAAKPGPARDTTADRLQSVSQDAAEAGLPGMEMDAKAWAGETRAASAAVELPEPGQ